VKFIDTLQKYSCNLLVSISIAGSDRSMGQKLQTEEFHDLWSSPDIIAVIKSRKIR
jgi:hypothetical protein